MLYSKKRMLAKTRVWAIRGLGVIAILIPTLAITFAICIGNLKSEVAVKYNPKVSKDCGKTWLDVATDASFEKDENLIAGELVALITPSNLGDVFKPREDSCLILLTYQNETSIWKSKKVVFKDGFDAEVEVTGTLKVINHEQLLKTRLAMVSDVRDLNNFNKDYSSWIKDMTATPVIDLAKNAWIDESAIESFAESTNLLNSSEVSAANIIREDPSVLDTRELQAMGLELDPSSIVVKIRMSQHTKDLLGRS